MLQQSKMSETKANSTWKVAGPKDAHQLPSRYYYDETLHREELDRIVYPGWHMVCHKNEIPEIGDYVLLDICGQSIFVVRTAGDEIAGFHNVCQHRGTLLLQAPRGKVNRTIRCPNHAWCYGFDGTLRSAPAARDVEGFDRSKYSLKRVLIEEVMHCVFVNMDLNASSLGEAIPGAVELMAERIPDLPDMQLISENSYDVAANWKIVIENAIEGYHFKLSDMGPYHRQLIQHINCKKYDPKAYGKFWVYQGHRGERLTEAYGKPVGDEPFQTEWFFNMQIWPMTTLFTFPYVDFFGTFNLMPLGPEKTRVGFNYYHPEREVSDVTRACIEFQTNLLGPEDIALNELQQRGMRSFGYDAGPYMVNDARKDWSEHLLHHFHALIHEAMAG